MSKLPPRRYQIWTYAPKSPASWEGLEFGRRDLPERSKARDSAQRADLYGDIGKPRRALTQGDDSAVSLYHYGLPIEIELPGLCILPNGRTGACKTKKISSERVDLIYDGGIGTYRFKLPGEMPLGSPISMDLDRIGEFRGALTTQSPDGFQLAVDAECKDMMSNRLALLAAAIRNAGLDDSMAAKPSGVTRLEPETKNCRFTDHVGIVRKGTIINVSQVDALIKAPIVPPVTAHIVFAGPYHYVAEVTRVFEIGFAVNFCPPIPADQFSAAIRLTD